MEKLEDIEVMKVNFQPVHQYILVEVPTVKEETDSGIIKGDAVIAEELAKAQKNNFVKIVAISEDCKSGFNVGEEIMHVQRVSNTYVENGKTYALIHEINVCGRRLFPVQSSDLDSTDTKVIKLK